MCGSDPSNTCWKQQHAANQTGGRDSDSRQTHDLPIFILTAITTKLNPSTKEPLEAEILSLEKKNPSQKLKKSADLFVNSAWAPDVFSEAVP